MEDWADSAYGVGWNEEAAEEKNASVEGGDGIRGRLDPHPPFHPQLDSVDHLEVAEFPRTRPSRDRFALSRSQNSDAFPEYPKSPGLVSQEGYRRVDVFERRERTPILLPLLLLATRDT